MFTNHPLLLHTIAVADPEIVGGGCGRAERPKAARVRRVWGGPGIPSPRREGSGHAQCRPLFVMEKELLEGVH